MITIFEIRKKDVMIGYLAYFLKYAGNIIVLPFVVSSLSSQEFAVWNIFLAINSFVILFDLGYGVVISRFAMYAYSGAREIDENAIPNVNANSEPNYTLLYQLMISSKKIYGRISKYTAFVLIISTAYIFYITSTKFNFIDIIFSWSIFSLSVVINMHILSETTIIKGLGMVGELQKITLVNSLMSIIAKILLLKLGYKLAGLSIAFFITAIVLAFQYYQITNKIRNIDIAKYKNLKIKFDIDFSESFSVIKKKSRGIGGVLISNFIQNQLFVLIAPIFLSLELLGRYGLTWQIISIIGSLSSITFVTYTMRMGNYMVSNNLRKLRETFSITAFIFIFLYVSGATFTFFYGYSLLDFFNTNFDLLPRYQIALMSIYSFVLQVNQKSTTIISLGNNQSYVKSLLISSILISLSNILVLSLGLGITAVLIINISVHGVYNFWKWSALSMTICDVSLLDIFIRPIQMAKHYVLKTNKEL